MIVWITAAKCLLIELAACRRPQSYYSTYFLGPQIPPLVSTIPKRLTSLVRKLNKRMGGPHLVSIKFIARSCYGDDERATACFSHCYHRSLTRRDWDMLLPDKHIDWDKVTPDDDRGEVLTAIRERRCPHVPNRWKRRNRSTIPRKRIHTWERRRKSLTSDLRSTSYRG